MKQWYKVTVAMPNKDKVAYFYADDVISVLTRAKRIPGARLRRKKFPNVEPLSAEESKALEDRIIEEGRIPLYKAKRFWYYG